MKNLRFTMSYDGTNYHGFQMQKNILTIEKELIDAFYKITGENVNIIGCGRTDAGVHAIKYYFNVKTESNIPEIKFPLALNSVLPGDISILNCVSVPLDFHSRFDAIKKTYLYRILNSNIRNPFLEKYAYFYPRQIDVDILKEYVKCFIGEKDFKAFMAQGSPVSSTVRTIFNIDVNKNGDIIDIEITGNGFLYNMVRIIVGTLINTAVNKYSCDCINSIIESKNRENAGPTVPARGLFLKEVYYDK